MYNTYWTVTVSLAVSLCGRVLAQNYNAAYDAAWCSKAEGHVDQEMKRLKSQGGVCFAPVYANGTGESHLYATAMDKCCEGGTAPVQLSSQGNAPWSDDDEILCARQCIEAKEWPNSDVERFQEMSRFSRCMEMAGIQEFGTIFSAVQCDIDDDLLWDGANEGVRPDGAEDIDNDDSNGPDVVPDLDNITGDEKACPNPRRNLEDVLSDPLTDDDHIFNIPGPICIIPVPKTNTDWSSDVMKNCCKGQNGSFPAWPGDEDTIHCERVCQPAWDEDQDEKGQLKALEELNKCFLKPSWSDSDGRRPYVACYGFGNLTLESADPTGEKSVQGSEGSEKGNDDGNKDDGGEAEQDGSGDDGSNINDSEDDDNAAASCRTLSAGLHLGSILAVGGWLASSW